MLFPFARAHQLRKEGSLRHMQHGGLLEITGVNKESLLGVRVERARGRRGQQGKGEKLLGVEGRGAGLCKNRVEL